MEAIGPENAAKLEFAEFFRQSYARVVALLVTLGGDRQEAEDAAQETFMLAYESWDGIQYPHAWVRRVAYRTLLRRLQRDRRAGLLSEELYFSAADLTESDSSESALEQQKVLELLRSLPSRQRVTLALYYDGLSLPEIADILQISRGTVGVHLHRARQQLRDLLVADGSIAVNGTEAAP